MNKIEELENIQKLKDNGAITEKEFETEKQRILNNENIQNKTTDKIKNNNGIKVKKKTIKIIITIVAILAVVAVGILLTQIITTEINIKQTESKLREIDAEELKAKLIEELKKTKLYIEKESNNIFIGSMINDGITFDGYTCVSMLMFKNGFTEKDIVGEIEVPCFKIRSDSNGKFENIEYTEGILHNYIISNTVEKIFKDNYGIELTKSWGLFNFNGNFNGKYNERFNLFNRDYSYTNKGNIYIKNDNFLKIIIKEITDRDIKTLSDFDTEYRTTTFGLDF